MELFFVITANFTLLQRNTFEGILTSNGFRSYAIFTYRCQMMQWSGAATIGFKAAGNLYINHPISGQLNSSAIACANPQNSWNNLIYRLGRFSV